MSSPAYADYREDIGYTALVSELDVQVNGDDVWVTQVESASSGHWMPNVVDNAFVGKEFFNASGDDGVSGHATTVGRYFYGNDTAIAPGISTVTVYEGNHWLQDGFLRLFFWGRQPDKSSSRIANHSWVSSGASCNPEVLRRLDWVVDRDEFLQVAALNNGSTARELLSSSFNAITVGRTDASHPYGTAAVDEIYTAGRTAPLIVTPVTPTSYAAPVVSAAAALLIEVGHTDPDLSTDPVYMTTTNRNGDIIYNAERSEVIKAALMAGADRFTNNSGSVEITDYRGIPDDRTDNRLDRRYGAGQLNVYNSYRIVASGEQNSVEDHAEGQGAIAPEGFDYDPRFGGNDANATASYYFVADGVYTLLSAALVWNLCIDGGTPYSFDGTAMLYDMDLFLYDLTQDGTVVSESKSSNENTENLFVSLTRGHEYLLQVRPGPAQAAFNWDFALAWQIRADSDADMVPDAVDAFPSHAAEWQDEDGDAMGDAFESLIIDFDLQDPYESLMDVLPEDDFDNDAFTNMDEFVNGTDPTQFDLVGDINGDCRVNMSDFYILSDNWGATGENEADLNGDERVNMSDFYILSDNWGETCP